MALWWCNNTTEEERQTPGHFDPLTVNLSQRRWSFLPARSVNKHYDCLLTCKWQRGKILSCIKKKKTDKLYPKFISDFSKYYLFLNYGRGSKNCWMKVIFFRKFVDNFLLLFISWNCESEFWVWCQNWRNSFQMFLFGLNPFICQLSNHSMRTTRYWLNVFVVLVKQNSWCLKIA